MPGTVNRMRACRPYRLDITQRPEGNQRQDQPCHCIRQVVVAAIDGPNRDKRRNYEKESAHPLTLWQSPHRAEGRSECAGHVRAGKYARVDAVIAKHPKVEAPKDRLVRRKIL